MINLCKILFVSFCFCFLPKFSYGMYSEYNDNYANPAINQPQSNAHTGIYDGYHSYDEYVINQPQSNTHTGENFFSLMSLETLIEILEAVPDLLRRERNKNSWDLNKLSDGQLIIIQSLSKEYETFQGSKQWGNETFHSVEKPITDCLTILSSARGLGSNALRCFGQEYFLSRLNTSDSQQDLLRICDQELPALKALKELAEAISKDFRFDVSSEKIEEIGPFRDLYGRFYDQEVLKEVGGVCSELKANFADALKDSSLQNLSHFQRIEILSVIMHLGEMIKGFSPGFLKRVFGDSAWAPHHFRDKLAHSANLWNALIENDDSKDDSKDDPYIQALRSLANLDAFVSNYDQRAEDLHTKKIDNKYAINFEDPSVNALKGLKELYNTLNFDVASAPKVEIEDPFVKFTSVNISTKDLQGKIQELFFENKNPRKSKPNYQRKSNLLSASQAFKDWLNNDLKMDSEKVGQLNDEQLLCLLGDYDATNKTQNSLNDRFLTLLADFGAYWKDIGSSNRRVNAWTEINRLSLNHLSVTDAYKKFCETLEDKNLILKGVLPQDYLWDVPQGENPYLDIFHQLKGLSLEPEERRQNRLASIGRLITKIDQLQTITGLSLEVNRPFTLRDVVADRSKSQCPLFLACANIIAERSVKGFWRNNMHLGEMRKKALESCLKKESPKALSFLMGLVYADLMSVIDYPEFEGIFIPSQIKEVRNWFFHPDFLENDHLQFSFENKSPKSFFKKAKDIAADELSLLSINVHFLLTEAVL